MTHPENSRDDLPLCVDLDGTLLRSDSLHEILQAGLRHRPLAVMSLATRLLDGRPAFKASLAEVLPIDVRLWPWREDLLTFVQTERARGRTTVLTTGTSRRVADAVARHLGVFGEVIASDATQNLTRRIKAAVLEARFGRGGFCYVGSSSVDVPTWRTAGEVMVAGGGRSLDRHLRSEGIAVHRRFNPDGTAFAALIRALRPHQWSKNLLCFLPVLAGHAWMLDSLLRGAGAAASLCCAASGAYLFNDFLDLDHDRDHPKKQARPFAGGTLSPLVALVLSPVLFFAGITFLGGFAPRAVPWLLLYVAVALAYALDLKRRLMVDVVALAILYTLRVSVGGAATGIKPSPWLLAFSITCFASLAMSKRVSELLSLRSAGGVEEARGRGYSVADTPSMQALGIGCSVAAVLVLALYLTSPQSVPLYRHPDRLWFACLALFYWFGRLWLIAGRGRLDEDPILFAVRDPISYATGLIVALAIVLAL